MRTLFSELEQQFDRYTSQYGSEDPKIQRNFDLKIYHTKKVCENAAGLAEDLELKEAELFVIKTAALFHDIGRFEQYHRYNTFVDKHSKDHAELGVEVLDHEGFLKDLPAELKTPVVTAIRFHNKLEVPQHLTEHEEFFTRLLRDADKLDIFRVVTEYYEQQKSGEHNEAIVLGLPDDKFYSKAVIDDILNREIVKSQDLKTINDFKLLQMAWVFDINFSATMKRLEKKQYIEKIYSTLPWDEKIKKACEIIFQYLKENCIKDQKAILF